MPVRLTEPFCYSGFVNENKDNQGRDAAKVIFMLSTAATTGVEIYSDHEGEDKIFGGRSC
jgi:hypothetical protein